MSDGDTLLSAIFADPDADLPRLMYADWLEEFGNDSDRARAELIRVQVELALASTEDNHRDGLRARERLLLERHRDQWLAPLRAPGEPLPKSGHAMFRRGFIELVWMDAAWFTARAEVLFARAPVRELRIMKTTIEELAELVANPYFPRLRALDLSDRRLGDDVARVLTKRPTTAAIRTLRLPGCGLTDVGAYRLADAEFDWPLVELDVRFNDLSVVGLTALRERFGPETVTSSS